MIEIPLNSSPEQLFSIVISGSSYDIRVTLNSRLGVWTIAFSKSGVSILEGISMVGGIDISSPYNIPVNNLYIVDLDQPELDPSRSNLGTVSKLFVLTDEEVSGG
jgi:hypothetical protein